MNQKRRMLVLATLTLALLLSIFLLITLLAPRVLAQSSVQAQPPQQASQNQICPLSDEQTDQAVEAFAKIATVFRQPRCINCHGGINPFAENTTHPGGEFEPIFKTVPNPLAGEPNSAAPGGVAPDEYTTQDDEATFGQCATCHDQFPGVWQIPPDVLFFVGKDNLALCKQERFFFERKADQFLQHIERDSNPNNPFIQEAFTGNMGGAANTPVPPKGVTHQQLIEMAKQWVKAQGGKFRGSDECGCKPLQYVMDMVITGGFDLDDMRVKDAGKATLPLTFEEENKFSGQVPVDIERKWNVDSPDFICDGKAAFTVTFKVNGEVNDDGTTLNAKFSWPAARGTAEGTCVYDVLDGWESSSGSLTTSGASPLTLGFDMPAEVGATKTITIPYDVVNGKTDFTITLRQVQ